MEPKNPDRIPRSETSFSICPILEAEISNEPLVLLPHNISDEEITRRDIEACQAAGIDTRYKYIKIGKYSAFGFPGGGVESERLDTPRGAAIAEIKAETGLETLRVEYLFTEGKMILTHKRTKKMVKQFFFQMGKRPSVTVTPNIDCLENPVNIFLARVDWENSVLRKIMVQKTKGFIKNGHLTKKEVREVGTYIRFKEDLTDKEVESLGIEELNEIDGIGVFTLSFLEGQIDQLRKVTREQRPIYLSHMLWLQRGLKEALEKGIGF